jgi:eukaryotic translation initiation factor 2C
MVIKKVWNSEVRRQATGTAILFDGNKLAWSKVDLGEKRMMIDLDAEQGRTGHDTSRNAFRLVIKKSKELEIGKPIQAYLSGQIQMDVAVLEAVNFLDHLLRENPSTSPNFITVRRSFFTRNGQRMALGKGIEVVRGVYQSLRLAEGKKLIVNLDVANCCFWQPSSLTSAIIAKYGLRDVQNIIADCKVIRDNGSVRPSQRYKIYEKDVKKLLVVAKYNGIKPSMANKQWTIKGFTLENARERMIEIRKPGTKVVDRTISIFDYFRQQYNVTLLYPLLPLVEMTKKGVLYPMEFLHLVENQRYAKKLDEVQTANMIKFAVAPPKDREKAINEGKGWLNWAGDPIANSFGLKIDPNMTKTNARLLPAPGVKFGNKTEQPGTRGRWDLRGKRFLQANPNELVAWGIGVFTNGKIRADKGAIDGFVAGFTRAYRDHGGRVSNQPPHTMILPNDPGQAVEQLHQATGNKYQRRPQLLVFLVQDKNSFHYTRIKKSCDCRYGVVSQVMQLAQVIKGNPQYYSNVLMKVNAKLGGCTTSAEPAPNSGFKGVKEPTMFIGGDVSHASPGSPQASMAAITVSFDRFGGRYAAACQTNGHRVEMISESNWNYCLKPLCQQWQSNVGGGKLPTQVYYFRDGVSEGQYIQVLNEEVVHIKSVLSSLSNSGPWNGKITVVIAAKRHHSESPINLVSAQFVLELTATLVRAFPAPGAGDQKGNPLPGCLIERDVTTPFEWDFYLYSHTALQGTARPVHYTILRDDANHEPNRIQNMIYEHCYQYMRSTTAVSMFPAVYYAHLGEYPPLRITSQFLQSYCRF